MSELRKEDRDICPVIINSSTLVSYFISVKCFHWFVCLFVCLFVQSNLLGLTATSGSSNTQHFRA
jgi:hypothetical protein